MPKAKSKQIVILQSSYSPTNLVADLNVMMDSEFSPSSVGSVNLIEDTSVSGDMNIEFQLSLSLSSVPIAIITLSFAARGDSLASGVSMATTGATTSTVSRATASTVTPIASPDAYYERVWQQPALNGSTVLVDQVTALEVRVKAQTGYTVTQTVTSTAPGSLELTYAWLDSNGAPQITGFVKLLASSTAHAPYTLGDVTVTDDPPANNALGSGPGGRKALRERLRELAKKLRETRRDARKDARDDRRDDRDDRRDDRHDGKHGH